MLRKPRSRVARTLALALAAMFVLLASAAPLATADHAYSHRYVVFGQVVDADGEPVAGVTVNVRPNELVPAEGPCNPGQPGTETDAFGRTEMRLTTNAYGEFIACFHTHSMARASEGALTVSAEGAEETVAADPLLRRNYVTLQLDEDRELSEASQGTWTETYTVSGRVWTDTGKTTIEGVRVYGETINEEPVTITFLPAGGGDPVEAETETNGYGDFSVRIPIGETVEGGKVKIEVKGETYTYDADMETRASDHVIQFEESQTGKMILVFGGIGLIGLMAFGLSGGFGKLKGKGATKGGRKR